MKISKNRHFLTFLPPTSAYVIYELSLDILRVIQQLRGQNFAIFLNFYTLSVDKNRHFFDSLPPLNIFSTRVIIERHPMYCAPAPFFEIFLSICFSILLIYFFQYILIILIRLDKDVYRNGRNARFWLFSLSLCNIIRKTSVPLSQKSQNRVFRPFL